MQIDKILYQLLLQHECVIIPGLGGFIVRESPCNFNLSKEILKPYGKSVFFNPHLTDNDGLLINAIVKNNGVDYSEATVLLDKWMNRFETDLAETGKSNISQIGVFYKGNDNGKWFTPEPNLNLALSSYGLKSVKSELSSITTTRPAEQPIEIKPLADNKPLETIEVPMTNWKAWAAAAAIALLAHVGYLAFEKKGDAVQEASVITAITHMDSPPVEIIPEEAETAATTDAEETTSNKVIETAEPTTVNEIPANEDSYQPSENNYQINSTVPETMSDSIRVIGKYKLEQNAVFHQKDLAKTGIQTYINKNEKGLYEVIASPSVPE